MSAVSQEGIAAWWASLSPEKRKTLMGVGCLAALMVVLYLFMSAGPDDKGPKRAESKADINLLTGQDTRTLGLEAVGAELREAQRKQHELQGLLDKLNQKASSKDEVKALVEQVNALADSLKSEGEKRVEAFEEIRRSGRTNSSPKSLAEQSPSGMPEASQRDAQSPARSTPASKGAPTRDVEIGEPIKLQVFGEGEPRAATGPAASEEGIYLPAGSILSGVLLTGVDAPTGMQSKRDPIPALMRIKHEAILPNRFASDVRECFVLFGAMGDLSTERALMRAEVLSCIRQDGGAIEVVLDAFALGDDGKAGVRGRLVSRNGSLVAKAAFASFAQALSQIFRPVAIQGLNTSPGQRTEFQAPDTAEALEAAGYAGMGGAMRSLSDYFISIADEIVPFVEVDAARQVEAVLLKGVTLKIRSAQA